MAFEQERLNKQAQAPSLPRQRIDLIKGQEPPEPEFVFDDPEPVTKFGNSSIYEMPQIETVKSLDGWMENFASDWNQLIKGISMIVPTIWDSLFDKRDGIIPNIEHIPEIFNRTLPQESRPHSWLKDVPLVGDMDKFQLGRELLITGNQIIEATVEPYKDGVFEAAYKHPLFLFLDATAVASVMGKGAVSVGKVTASTARSNAMSKMRTSFIQKGLKGADLDRAMHLSDLYTGRKVFQDVMSKAERIGKGIAGAPFLPFTGPFKGAHKFLSGPMKEALPGRMYTAFQKTLQIDEISTFVHRTIGTHKAQMPMVATTKIKEILEDMGKMTKAETNYFFDSVFGMDDILKHYPDSELAREIGKPMLDDARMALIEEKAIQYRRRSIDDLELDRREQGFLDEDKMKTSRATSALNWIAYRKAEAEIAARIAGGAKSQKKYILFGEDVLSKSDRIEIHTKWRKQYLKKKTDFDKNMELTKEEIKNLPDLPGDRALRDMKAAMDQIEVSGKKEVPYLPYVQERMFDGVEFIENMVHMSFPEFRAYRGEMERRYGKGAITMNPDVIVSKHIFRAEEVKAHRAAQFQILEKYGVVVKAGEKAPDGYVRYDYKFLLENYMDAQGLVRESIAKGFIAEYERLAKIFPDDIGKVEHLALKNTLRGWAKGAKGITETKAIGETFRKFIDDPKNFEVHTYLPKQAMKSIEAHMERMTGPMKAYQKGMNVFRFMALNMFPRFYINNFVGNSVLTLFSGGGAKRLPPVKMEEFAEAAQNVFIQEPGIFTNLIYGNAWAGSRGYSKFLDWFQRQAEYPGRAMTVAYKLEGLAEQARLTGTVDSARAALVAQEDLFRTFLKDYRSIQWKGYKTATVANHVEYGFKQAAMQMQKRENYKSVLQKTEDKLHSLTSEAGNTYGKLYIEELGESFSKIENVKQPLEDLGATGQSTFFKQMDEILDKYQMGKPTEANLSQFHDYLRTGNAWEDLKGSINNKNHKAAKKVLDTLKGILTRREKALAKISRMEDFVRGTERVKPADGLLITEKDIHRHLRDTLGLPPEAQAGRLEDYIRVQETGQPLLPFDEVKLWESAFGINRYSKEARALIEEAIEHGNSFHKANRIHKEAARRLDDLDPMSLMNKMEDELAKVLPNEDIAKVRHKMMDESIQYMENFFGNYNAMHPLERKIVRNLFPFWTFPKTMFKLMWKLPGLRPKTAGLWANFSKFMLDSTDPDTFKGRNSSSMIWGGDKDGNLVVFRWNSWVPMEAATLRRFANRTIMPGGLNPLLANPLIKMAVEWQTGQDLFTGKPWGDKAFLTTTGQKYEIDERSGKFKMVTPQKDFEDGIYSLFPHWSFIQEMVNPNYKVPRIGDEYIYDRNRIMGLGRLLGVPVTVQNPEKQIQIDRYYRKLLKKKIRNAMKYRSIDEQALGRAMLNHLDKEENRRGAEGYVWTLNTPY